MKEQSYTSNPPMCRTACTEPQCLYKGALYRTCWSGETSSGSYGPASQPPLDTRGQEYLFLRHDFSCRHVAFHEEPLISGNCNYVEEARVFHVVTKDVDININRT